VLQCFGVRRLAALKAWSAYTVAIVDRVPHNTSVHISLLAAFLENGGAECCWRMVDQVSSS